MPYVSKDDRPFLDKKVEPLAEELASTLADEMNRDTDLSTCYKTVFKTVAGTLHDLELKKNAEHGPESRAEELAHEIFGVAKKYGYRGAWLGELNYSMTRLIQVVPRKMVEKGVWKEELRYWLYAQTVGALERAALDVHQNGADDWITDGLVGVLIDVKDEYKRRVNTAYEAVQIKKSGDCYDAPFHTELVEVKDEKGDVKGYQEVMKDFRKK